MLYFSFDFHLLDWSVMLNIFHACIIFTRTHLSIIWQLKPFDVIMNISIYLFCFFRSKSNKPIITSPSSYHFIYVNKTCFERSLLNMDIKLNNKHFPQNLFTTVLQ